MAGWRELDEELKVWADLGRRAEFWWRDDDATEPSAALDRLIRIGLSSAVPLALAVIPASLHPDLPACLNVAPGVDVVQHGYRHRNYAPAGCKSSEFPVSRNHQEMFQEIADGWSLMGPFARARKVFVPPWNRISDQVVQMLISSGYDGVSTFGPRKPGNVSCVNAHVDLLNWRGNRRFVGEEAALDQMLRHLQNKRCGAHDDREPTGLLSHHRDHDAACWKYVETLFDWTRDRQVVVWQSVGQVFDCKIVRD